MEPIQVFGLAGLAVEDAERLRRLERHFAERHIASRRRAARVRRVLARVRRARRRPRLVRPIAPAVSP